MIDRVPPAKLRELFQCQSRAKLTRMLRAIGLPAPPGSPQATPLLPRPHPGLLRPLRGPSRALFGPLRGLPPGSRSRSGAPGPLRAPPGPSGPLPAPVKVWQARSAPRASLSSASITAPANPDSTNPRVPSTSVPYASRPRRYDSRAPASLSSQVRASVPGAPGTVDTPPSRAGAGASWRSLPVGQRRSRSVRASSSSLMSSARAWASVNNAPTTSPSRARNSSVASRAVRSAFPRSSASVRRAASASRSASATSIFRNPQAISSSRHTTPRPVASFGAGITSPPHCAESRRSGDRPIPSGP